MRLGCGFRAPHSLLAGSWLGKQDRRAWGELGKGLLTGHGDIKEKALEQAKERRVLLCQSWPGDLQSPIEREICPFPGADTALCTQQQLLQVTQKQASKIQHM